MVCHIDDSAMDRAEDVQAYLGNKFPTFVKSMLPSNVIRGFWMGLPRKFCLLHLPHYNITVMLEDENRKDYETIYIAGRTGLSGGWKKFSTEHRLLERDVLIFQLVEPSKFKVYILRTNCLSELDVAVWLMDFTHAKHEKFVEKFVEPLLPTVDQQNVDKESQKVLNINHGPLTNQSVSDSGDFSPYVSEDTISRPLLNFSEVNSLERFSILVNGVSIDSKLSDCVRTSYYELCCSQNSFLHDRLHIGIDHKLAADIISETVNIDSALGACKLSTNQVQFTTWDRILGLLEHWGMKVEFLRVRLNQLVSIAFKSKEAKKSRSYKRAKFK